MKILYFCNGSGLSPVKSGGATRFIEILRRLPETFQISIVGTIGSKILLENEKIKRSYQFVQVKASLWKEKETTQLDRILSYLISTPHSILIIPKLPKAEIVYSPSDLFCDVLPGFFYRVFRGSKWIVMVHHLCPPPWRRAGNFPINSFAFLGQRFSFFFIGLAVDKLLIYDTPMGEATHRTIQDFTLRKIKKERVYNGVDYQKIASVPKGRVRYDACFAGGLRASKGVFDVIDIWKMVSLAKPQARIAIAGQGTSEVENEVKKQIRNLNLEKNITLTGNLSQLKLYRLMKSSKLFISPSHEEGWGIAIWEALACGLPVINYSMPITAKIPIQGMIKIPFKEKKAFAKTILRLLQDKNFYQKMKKEVETQRTYSWEEVAKREIKTYKELCEAS